MKKRGKHCFSLVMYWFCRNNALYSAGLSFRLFIFLLTPSVTWDCYYFESNLSLAGVANKSVALEKTRNIVL